LESVYYFEVGLFMRNTVATDFTDPVWTLEGPAERTVIARTVDAVVDWR